jgi:hypothetical protein
MYIPEQQQKRTFFKGMKIAQSRSRIFPRFATTKMRLSRTWRISLPMHVLSKKKILQSGVAVLHQGSGMGKWSGYQHCYTGMKIASSFFQPSTKWSKRSKFSHFLIAIKIEKLEFNSNSN